MEDSEMSVSGMSGAASPSRAASSSSREIPLFVYPGQLDFYHDDQTTHKRVITIYNPFEFGVNFKMYCNNPKKYTVVEPEGKIGGQKCVDVVIRHVAVSPQAVEITDKFRVHMFEEGTSEILGKRDVLAILHPGQPEANSSSLDTRQRRTFGGAFPGMEGESAANNYPQREGHYGTNYVACFVALVCVFLLFLPTYCEPQESSFLEDYPWLHLPMSQKLVFAYVLGLVTVAILRT